MFQKPLKFSRLSCILMCHICNMIYFIFQIIIHFLLLFLFRDTLYSSSCRLLVFDYLNQSPYTWLSRHIYRSKLHNYSRCSYYSPFFFFIAVRVRLELTRGKTSASKQDAVFANSTTLLYPSKLN